MTSFLHKTFLYAEPELKMTLDLIYFICVSCKRPFSLCDYNSEE